MVGDLMVYPWQSGHEYSINFILGRRTDSLIKYIIWHNATYNLAHDLEFEVVAEGIETQEQLDYLKKHYCESGMSQIKVWSTPDFLNNEGIAVV